MTTRRLKIKGINRDHPIPIVRPTDFAYDLGEVISPEEVLSNPSFTLYCIDPDNDALIFVESDNPAAVDQAVFYYQGQVQHAVGLVRMPIDVFHRVAAQIPEPPSGVIFIHSTGRCGSTLLSKAFQAIPSIQSLSEPDDLTQMVNLRVAGIFPEESLRKLIVSSTKWRCKPRAGAPARQVAIKTRSEVSVLADLIGSLFGHSKHLFLYRNAVSWMGSVFRSFPPDRDVYDLEMNRAMEDSWACTLPLVGELRSEATPVNPVQVRILSWITSMEGYLKLKEMKVPACATRFEDLTSDPIPILQGIFEFCEITDVDWNLVQSVLGRDSQAGTIYGREERSTQKRELTEDLIEDIHRLIATRPLLKSADVILPGTLCLPG